MSNLIKSFEPNTAGRDFVIGDLHGAISTFYKLLQDLNFNPEVDRMFSVGDLVDRGEDSMACLRLIEEPWFHAIKANHEDMMIGAIKGFQSGDYWTPRNGAGWALPFLQEISTVQEITRDPAEQQKIFSPQTLDFLKLVDKADALPLMITIGGNVVTHLIHAELPLTSDTSAEALEDEVYSTQLLKMARVPGFLDVMWERRLFGALRTLDLVGSGVDKAKRTILGYLKPYRFDFKISNNRFISGHTILTRPSQIFNRICIDTCAYGTTFPNPGKHDALTCVELSNSTLVYYKCTKHSFESVSPFVVTTEDLNEYAAD